MIIHKTPYHITWMPDVGNDYVWVITNPDRNIHEVHMFMVSPISGKILTSDWSRFPSYVNRDLLLRWAIRKLGHKL